MDGSLQSDDSPELIFGLVAPIGVDLNLVSEVLAATIEEMGYNHTLLRLTELMREAKIKLPLDAQTYVESYKQRISYANEVRRKLGVAALAALSISAIRSTRLLNREKGKVATDKNNDLDTLGRTSVEDHEVETPIPSRAYIIRQFKRPEEINLMRSVYGRQFIVV